MPPRQKAAMMLVCFFVFFFILYLVRRRKLREEYCWLWLLTSLSMFLLIIKYSWLQAITKMMGAVLPTSTLFIGALIFLMFLSIQFSVIISKLTKQVKNLVQETALLRAKIEEMSGDR